MTFCFVDIIPNNRKVVLTFFLHSSELQNSTKLLKPLAEVTVNWLATCVLCLLFFPTKHHENHKRLMNRSALKSFGEWCFQKPPLMGHSSTKTCSCYVSMSPFAQFPASLWASFTRDLHRVKLGGGNSENTVKPFTTKNARKTSRK